FGSATQTVAKVVIGAAAVAVIGVTLRVAHSGGNEAWSLRLSVSALVTALLIVSSVTWQHHLVTLLLPLATGIAWITVRRPGARYGWWLLAAYAMCWMDRRAFPLPADMQVHSWTDAALVLAGTSVKLVGLLLLWTLLLHMLRLEARRASVRRLDQPADGSAGPTTPLHASLRRMAPAWLALRALCPIALRPAAPPPSGLSSTMAPPVATAPSDRQRRAANRMVR